MIGKVVRGERVAGLLHYLFGPGRANEHTNPHLAAAWDPVEGLEPVPVNGKHDVRALAALLQQPLLADFRDHPRPVWHCALRAAPQDRRLSDAEWGTVVQEVLDSAGLAPKDDDGGCRWVAVRHSDDHVHVVLTLARQDGGPVTPFHDYYRVGEACRKVEELFDLQRTAARDSTAGRRPSRAETEKAGRRGRTEEPRVQLRRAVHSAAAITDSPASFLAELRAAGVHVRERFSEQDPTEVTGYAVAWAGDLNAQGQPVWFGGSKLAPELSWAKLSVRWQSSAPSSVSPDGQEAPPSATTPPARPPRLVDPGARREAVHHAAASAREAALDLGNAGPASPGADDVAAAGGDLIAVTGRLLEGRADGTVSRTADRYQRAARTQWGRLPAPSAVAGALRIAARDLARMGRARRTERDDLADLLRATASLVDALVELRMRQVRLEQAQAAREAAATLRTAAAQLRSSPIQPPVPAGAALARPAPQRLPRSTS